jgi:hypothetical protein
LSFADEKKVTIAMFPRPVNLCTWTWLRCLERSLRSRNGLEPVAQGVVAVLVWLLRLWGSDEERMGESCSHAQAQAFSKSLGGFVGL